MPNIDAENFEYVEPTLISIKSIFSNLSEGPMIPFWNCEVPMLFIAGSDDRLQPSKEQVSKCLYLILFNIVHIRNLIFEAELAGEILKTKGRNDFQVSIHEGLGHLVDLPFSPPTIITNHALFPKPYLLVMGGDDLEKHGRAQEKVWQQLLHFFKTSLS